LAVEIENIKVKKCLGSTSWSGSYRCIHWGNKKCYKSKHWSSSVCWCNWSFFPCWKTYGHDWNHDQLPFGTRYGS